MASATSRKELAQTEFKNVEAKIERNLEAIINTEDYNQIQELNEENNNIYNKYAKTNDENEEVGYDMNTFKQDTKNTGKILGALHKMTLKGYESKSFKFNWKGVADGMKRLNDLDVNAEPKTLTRNNWLKAAHRTFIMTGFPTAGYSSTYFHCHQALSGIAKIKTKREPKNESAAGSKAKNDAAKKRAEQKIDDAADEQADVQEDYDQNDGQISTVVLQKCLDTIALQVARSEFGKIEYFRAVIDPKSNGFAKTIENIFHVSFLIKAGEVGIIIDRNGIPWLILLEKGREKANCEELALQERQAAAAAASASGSSSKSKSKSKNAATEPDLKKQKLDRYNASDKKGGRPAQGVMVLTMELWEGLVDVMELDKVDGTSIF